MKQQTYKLLFIDLSTVNIEDLQIGLEGMPIWLVNQHGTNIAYIIDTKIPVTQRTKGK